MLETMRMILHERNVETGENEAGREGREGGREKTNQRGFRWEKVKEKKKTQLTHPPAVNGRVHPLLLLHNCPKYFSPLATRHFIKVRRPWY